MTKFSRLRPPSSLCSHPNLDVLPPVGVGASRNLGNSSKLPKISAPTRSHTKPTFAPPYGVGAGVGATPTPAHFKRVGVLAKPPPAPPPYGGGV